MFRLSSRRVVELEAQVKDLQDELQVKGAISEDVSICTLLFHFCSQHYLPG